MLLLLLNNLSPTQLAQYLSESFGYQISASVIVKWDNLILRKERFLGKDKGKPHRRVYSQSDMILFNAIFIMRSLGYSIEQIRQVFDMDLRNPDSEKECSDFISSIRAKITKQKQGLDLYDAFFSELKRARMPIDNQPVFKPATPEEIVRRKKEQP